MCSDGGPSRKSYKVAERGFLYIYIYEHNFGSGTRTAGETCCLSTSFGRSGSTYTPSGNYYSKCMPVESSEGTGKHSSPSLINFGRLFSVNIFACCRGRGLQPPPYHSVHTRLRDRSSYSLASFRQIPFYI